MYQYSFANVTLTLIVPPLGNPNNPLDFPVEGYGAGEGLIQIARRAPIATTQFGAYGPMVVSMQRIKATDLSFTVLMNSPENQYLQDWANWFQEQAWQGGQLVEPIQARLHDHMGNDHVDLTNGVILNMPAIVRGQTMNLVTWVISFESSNFSRNIGGSYEKIGIF